MTPDALARLHGACFDDTPPPWSVRQFADLLDQPGTLLVSLPDGFAAGRSMGPEAELLTLAVSPGARRRGLASRLLAGFERAARGTGAEEIFLEVAVTNHAARSLYEKAGYAPVGRRPGYYARPGAPALDALILRKLLASDAAQALAAS